LIAAEKLEPWRSIRPGRGLQLGQVDHVPGKSAYGGQWLGLVELREVLRASAIATTT
jgi:hypothetical protein